MNYRQKGNKWIEKLKEGSKDLMYLGVEDKRWVCINGLSKKQPDYIYYCIRQNGERVIENSWNPSCVEERKEQFVIKEEKKIIFTRELDTAYGFGFGDGNENRRMVLYIRIGRGAQLMWADSASSSINCMYTISVENPEELDSLIEFFKTDLDDTGDNETEVTTDGFNRAVGI